MAKPALDSLLLEFRLVRTKYIFLRVSPLLFCRCSKAALLRLFPTEMLRLSILNVFLGRKLHLPALHDTNKIKDYKLTSFSESSVVYHIMCFLLQLFQCIYICLYFVLANNK